jgi:small subunit ribosomal protein S2
MPFVTERWLGGMMTNFATIRRSIKKMENIDRLLSDGSYTSITKKEKLTLSRERDKLEKVLGGISKLNRIPSAMFVIDITNEHLAIEEAQKLGIRTFAMVDTNSNPNLVDFPIPSNDDASKSIRLITNYLVAAIKEGLEERQQTKAALETESA